MFARPCLIFMTPILFKSLSPDSNLSTQAVIRTQYYTSYSLAAVRKGTRTKVQVICVLGRPARVTRSERWANPPRPNRPHAPFLYTLPSNGISSSSPPRRTHTAQSLPHDPPPPARNANFEPFAEQHVDLARPPRARTRLALARPHDPQARLVVPGLVHGADAPDERTAKEGLRRGHERVEGQGLLEGPVGARQGDGVLLLHRVRPLSPLLDWNMSTNSCRWSS